MEVTLLAEYPHDAPKIAQWYYNEWACHAPNVSENMVLDDIVEKSTNQNKIPLAIIARKNNELVGVAEIKYRENKKYHDYVYWLGGVFVAPEYRGTGISSLLIANAQSKAVKLGVDKLYLQCEMHNIKLYQKHGFQLLHPANDVDMSVVIMVWEKTT